jgi:hypothetical protein
MLAEQPKIIISEDGRTYYFEGHGSEHEFYTIAGVEEAISIVRADLNTLRQISGNSDQKVRDLEESMRNLELQRKLAGVRGV